MARRLWAFLAGAIWMTSPVNAGQRLLGSEDAPPPPAWVEFCERRPMECHFDVLQPDAITMTPELHALLSSVNLKVNRMLIPVTDKDHWGVADLWSYPDDGLGDCEDYQLLKREFLVKAGLPRRALLMTVVIDEKGEGHAVLTVRTTRGDFILDNKTDRVSEWFETQYTYVKRESYEKAGWVFLTREPVGTMLTASRD